MNSVFTFVRLSMWALVVVVWISPLDAGAGVTAAAPQKLTVVYPDGSSITLEGVLDPISDTLIVSSESGDSSVESGTSTATGGLKGGVKNPSTSTTIARESPAN